MFRLIVIAGCLAAFAMAADDAYTPLRLYHGTWKVTKASDSKRASDTLVDECALIGKYFACQQTVNGKIGALIIFLPTDVAGHYYTNSVNNEGRAGGRGDLEIKGDRWVYSSQGELDGKVTYYRTVNVFTGKDRIHYEVGESSDGEHWTVKNSGDEVRAK